MLNNFRQIDGAVMGYIQYKDIDDALALEEFYIAFRNDWLTYGAFAEYYGITVKLAMIATHLGKNINHKLRG